MENAMTTPRKIKFKGALYVLAAQETHSWKTVGTKQVTVPGGNVMQGKGDSLNGKATLYKYTGSDPKVGYAAVFVCKPSKDASLPESAYIDQAILKAFGIQGRSVSAKGHYTDWGPPIGIPAEFNGNRLDKTGKLVSVWYKKA